MTDDLDLTEDHERVRIDLGGYVLGNLTVAEQHAVEAHLETCAACRAELLELEGIPVLLDLARPDADTPTRPTPRPTPRPAPVGTVDRPVPAHRPQRSRRTRVLVGAAGALAIAAALVVGILIGRPDQPDFGRTIPLQTAAAVSAPGSAGAGSGGTPSGTAALRSTDNGTVVRLDLEGLPTDGSWYECTWSSGQSEQSAGTFRPAPDGTANIDLTTAARAYPGWKLTIIEHPQGAADGEAVLEASA
ncbi:MAG: anti-sigma factor family protein [Acidimicrobiales bacterium]